jgi:hypothetical protein
MKTHVPANLIFVLAVILYAVGAAGAGMLAAGITFVLEAKAWSQVITEAPLDKSGSRRRK